MPIDRDKWNRGDDRASMSSRVYEFLNANRDQAFTLNEIVVALAQKALKESPAGPGVDKSEIVIALHELETSGKARAKVVKEFSKETVYFASM
jgi:hypothetical protein